MVLPLGDSPNSRSIPWITYSLILANVAVYILVSFPLSTVPADPSDPLVGEYIRVVTHSSEEHLSPEVLRHQISTYDLLVFKHGFKPSQPAVDDLFVSLFLHAGFLHLFGNMLILWIYGDNVEHRLGPLRYLFAYLAAGATATLVHMGFAHESSLPLIGASGAISGILGFYFRWFPHNKVRLLVLLFPFLMDVFVVPARLVLGFYLIADNLLPFLLSDATKGGVAYGAHIGGFVAGVLASWILDRHEIDAPPDDFTPAAAPAPLSAIDDAINAGHFADAAQQYFALPTTTTRDVLSPAQGLALAAWLRRNRHPDAALSVYRRLLRDHRTGAGVADAHLGAGLVLMEDLQQPTPAYQHLLDALDADPSPEIAAQARAALQSIVGQQKFQIGKQRRPNW